MRGGVSQVDDMVVEHDGAFCMLQSKLKTLEYRTEDTKNRCRCNNIRIIGLAEGTEGKNPTVFT